MGRPALWQPGNRMFRGMAALCLFGVTVMLRPRAHDVRTLRGQLHTISPVCRERSISGLRAGALPRLASETRLRAQ